MNSLAHHDVLVAGLIRKETVLGGLVNHPVVIDHHAHQQLSGRQLAVENGARRDSNSSSEDSDIVRLFPKCKRSTAVSSPPNNANNGTTGGDSGSSSIGYTAAGGSSTSLDDRVSIGNNGKLSYKQQSQQHPSPIGSSSAGTGERVQSAITTNNANESAAALSNGATSAPVSAAISGGNNCNNSSSYASASEHISNGQQQKHGRWNSCLL